jgi:hypothetical protein
MPIIDDFKLFKELPDDIQQLIFQYVFDRADTSAHAVALSLVSRKVRTWSVNS